MEADPVASSKAALEGVAINSPVEGSVDEAGVNSADDGDGARVE